MCLFWWLVTCVCLFLGPGQAEDQKIALPDYFMPYVSNGKSSEVGLKFDRDSCGPWLPLFRSARAGLQAYINAALRKTRDPEDTSFSYWFRPEMNQTVTRVFKMLNSSLNGGAPLLQVRCVSNVNDHQVVCGDYGPFSWVNYNQPGDFLNFCPQGLLYMQRSYPDPCDVPRNGRELDAQPGEKSGKLQNDIEAWFAWMTNKGYLTEMMIEGLIATPTLSGKQLFDENYPFLIHKPDKYRTARGSHFIMYHEIEGLSEGSKNWEATEWSENWVYFAKDAWGNAQWLKNQRPARKEQCANRKPPTPRYSPAPLPNRRGRKRPKTNESRPEALPANDTLSRDELRRFRRLKAIYSAVRPISGLGP